MDSKTHQRGRGDTSNRRLAKLLVVSVLLHVPLTPLAALAGLFSMWSSTDDAVTSPPITGIPIDIIEDEAPSPGAPEQPTSAPDNAGPGEPALAKPPKKPVIPTLTDAGAPDAADAESDAGDAGETDAGRAQADAGGDSTASDAGPSDAGPADAGAKPLADPTMVAGMKRVADPNANVRITIYNEKIRQNPLGKRIGPLLGSLFQWRDFFGPSGIDPIRDIDQMFVSGSQLRNSSNVVAVLRHHLPAAKMHAALDTLVRADTSGEWLDAGVPVASAHADGAERRFVLANAETVVVTPLSAYAGVLAAGKLLRLAPSKGPEVAMIYLATPWRAFIGLPIKIPESITWARVRITPTADGGATAEVDAEDADPEKAAADAAYLSRSADALSQLNLGLFGSILGVQSHRFIERVSFSADGKMIRGSAYVTADQLQTALDMAGAFMADRASRKVKTAPAPTP